MRQWPELRSLRPIARLTAWLGGVRSATRRAWFQKPWGWRGIEGRFPRALQWARPRPSVAGALGRALPFQPGGRAFHAAPL